MKHGAIKAEKTLAASTPILIIGYGNPLRRDDGAGRVVAEKLAQYWSNQGIAARVMTDIQLTPEMVEEIAGDEVDTVIFVDSRTDSSALASQLSPFQISPIMVDTVSPSLGHFVEPKTLLVYAALLYFAYPRAWLVTIPGGDFAHGHGFSDEVSRLLDDVATLAEELRAQMQAKESVPCMS